MSPVYRMAGQNGWLSIGLSQFGGTERFLPQFVRLTRLARENEAGAHVA
jgi:hypothetical protein